MPSKTTALGLGPPALTWAQMHCIKSWSARYKQHFCTNCAQRRPRPALIRSVQHTCMYQVATFIGKESAFVFNMGYATNSTVIPALMGSGSLVVSDSLNHVSPHVPPSGWILSLASMCSVVYSLAKTYGCFCTCCARARHP